MATVLYVTANRQRWMRWISLSKGTVLGQRVPLNEGLNRNRTEVESDWCRFRCAISGRNATKKPPARANDAVLVRTSAHLWTFSSHVALAAGSNVLPKPPATDAEPTRGLAAAHHPHVQHGRHWCRWSRTRRRHDPQMEHVQ